MNKLGRWALRTFGLWHIGRWTIYWVKWTYARHSWSEGKLYVKHDEYEFGSNDSSLPAVPQIDYLIGPCLVKHIL